MECLYCQNNDTLHSLMIEIAKLSVSRVFLFKEQTYRGRCLVAYNGHVDDINLLSDEERNAFMADVDSCYTCDAEGIQPCQDKLRRIFRYSGAFAFPSCAQIC